MLSQMDANNSLKHIQHIRKCCDEEGNIIANVNVEHHDEHNLLNDYFLTPKEVEKYKDEVKKHLPASDIMVCLVS